MNYRKLLAITLLMFLCISFGFSQEDSTYQNMDRYLSSFWISGSMGGGAVVSTNIINSGAVVPFRNDFLWQNNKARRLGFGFSHELFITPESLIRVILNESVSITKLYFTYEKFIFNHSPVNIGFSSNIGFFGTGDSLDNRGGMFANAGLVTELGIRPIYIFARPDIEYQSWSGLHKQLQVTISTGVRIKFLTREERTRRTQRKIRKLKRRSEKRKQKELRRGS